MGGDHQLQSRLFDELCALLLAFLRSPQLLLSSPLLPTPRLCVGAAVYRPTRRSQISPAGFALLLLGASFALVLCGSVTFVLGCILLPWVIGFVMMLYLVGIISSLSDFGKAILCFAMPEPSPTSHKEVSCSFSGIVIIAWFVRLCFGRPSDILVRPLGARVTCGSGRPLIFGYPLYVKSPGLQSPGLESPCVRLEIAHVFIRRLQFSLFLVGLILQFAIPLDNL